MQFCSQIINYGLSYVFYTTTNGKGSDRDGDWSVLYWKKNNLSNKWKMEWWGTATGKYSIYVEFCKEDSRLANSGERHLSVYTKQKVQKKKEKWDVVTFLGRKWETEGRRCGRRHRKWSWLVWSSVPSLSALTLPSLVPAEWGWCRRGPPWAWAGWQCPTAGSAIAAAARWTSAPAGRSLCGPGARS